MESLPKNKIATYKKIFVIECSSSDGSKKPREKAIRYPNYNNYSTLRISQLLNLISEEFDVSKKLRLYNFHGYEIIEDSDLDYLKEKEEFLNFIYFTRINGIFENKNFMRIYKIKEKIGEGGFGKVYLAQQKFTNHYFAIKIFRQSFFSAKNLNHLYKEIEILKKLDHPNIIKLYSNFVLDYDRIVLILEYISGGTLRSYLKEKIKLEEDNAKNIFIQLLEIINYCHNKNIIHRDLKLDNILFNDKEKSHIKLIDFGISGIIKNDEGNSGTPMYMAPELLISSNTLSLPSLDVWSLGCILYEILTGHVLFNGTKKEITERVLKENYELPEYISKEANHLILSMLQINSKNRISIKECFEDYWITNKTLPDELKMKLITRSNRRLKTENINLKYKGHHMKTSSHVERSEKKILRTRSNSKFIKDDRKNSSVKLPSLMTKITPNFEESLLYDYNFSIVRQFNGKIPNFLLPIGHSKQQKQKNLKIINLISNGFKLINKKKIESTNSEEKSERIMMRNKQKTMSFIQNNSTKKFYSPYKLTDEYKKPKILIDTQVGNKIKHVANKSTSAKDILFNKTISARKFRMNKMKIEER